jgi:hypothetical protein
MDNTTLCRIKVGETKEGQLPGIVGCPFERMTRKRNPRSFGIVIDEAPGDTFYYYTDANCKTLLTVHCQKGVVDHLRLKKGLWGPDAGRSQVPALMISEFELESWGTGSWIGLGDSRSKINKAHGKPHFDE